MVIAEESPTYDDRSVVAGSRLFIEVERRFWFDGPNGRHLCLVLPALGPDLFKLSNDIYTRFKPAFARQLSLQATRALAQLHSNGLYDRGKTTSLLDAQFPSGTNMDQHTSHDQVLAHNNGTDFTVTHMLLRLTDEFDALEEEDLYTLFGRPRTAPFCTYSGKQPKPHGPDYVVQALDFFSPTTDVNVLGNDLCIIGFDQKSFTITNPPTM